MQLFATKLNELFRVKRVTNHVTASSGDTRFAQKLVVLETENLIFMHTAFRPGCAWPRQNLSDIFIRHIEPYQGRGQSVKLGQSLISVSSTRWGSSH